MVASIVFLYILGFILFVFGLEDDENNNNTKNILYLGMSIFVNILGYYSSYSDSDYVSLAYLPLAMMALSVLVLIYTVWNNIPVQKSWGDEADTDND